MESNMQYLKKKIFDWQVKINIFLMSKRDQLGEK
ncbi:hypothetical protein CFP56_018631 [Quercus suber]|uniref:Uncharacterized protein n=1 Tax=Quercus suber TaxID=58331 RepID=A0AAW0M1N3_QUESU